MLEEVERWLTRRSWSSGDRPLNRLADARDADPRSTSVSVVLPALNEEATVGAIVAVIRRELMEKVRLVDELVVIDSGSTDATAAVARAAGARVVHRDAILPRIPALPGKGEVLWRSLLVTSGEIVCFIDADLRDFSAEFVSGTVGPLLTDPSVQFVKAMYDRPLGDRAGQGGRVTELVARPLLNLHWPQLAGFVQPLGGEYAVRRSLLERLPFPVGYGVELGLLVDALHTVGLDALGQVDVGVRVHRHQDGQALGRMAAAIYRTAQLRLSRGHLVRPALTQFERGEDGFVPRTHAVDTEERPPMREIAEYAERWAA
ncbi:glucosyl-3-phosphoglycerate synthase [Streptomyces griseus]|uniref:Glucosyl-3-phosphoglycerate synthase n=1 Tax=Streptomyces griseus subsp. griseus (strain JCM 4626 / CBS 651.72 / NBRC 13350 / KCC S-0626 / ISP 5235) TaxID=455632 RepID=B1VL30_STRGG|nr:MULTISPECIES: glucosyl-3-phosphoglycerate synthase [Streptomyces]MYR10105.1 glucosyl-3-phosphoglycerate synthase [Streptomyces sp. SID724]MYR50857.1 glucosyl-3-phosphoglycerate synthase [Streptomyces sp. SID4928]MYT79241.1 glucosyl-3-phosphoglycerate synthase [Streptomyces sp. SID8364]EGE42816.1 glycosyl transferase family 2 [Streptomyces sp. ACT-1]MYR14460.1 glucosyl-3-phosphoglycerate synthase [Streptomyces sp. SID724]